MAWSDVLLTMDQLHRGQGDYPAREGLQIMAARELWNSWLLPRRHNSSRNRVWSCVMQWCLDSAQPSPHTPSLPSLNDALVLFTLGFPSVKASPYAKYTLCKFIFPALTGWKWVTRVRDPFVRRAAAAMERGRLLPASLRSPALCASIAEYLGHSWQLVIMLMAPVQWRPLRRGAVAPVVPVVPYQLGEYGQIGGGHLANWTGAT